MDIGPVFEDWEVRMSENLIGELQAYEGDSVEQILRDLLNDKNIELKTELKNPLMMSKARLLVTWCRAEGLTTTADLLEAFIEFYVRDMVSYNRSSRTEITQAIAEIMKRDQGLKQRLLGGSEEGGI